MKTIRWSHSSWNVESICVIDQTSVINSEVRNVHDPQVRYYGCDCTWQAGDRPALDSPFPVVVLSTTVSRRTLRRTDPMRHMNCNPNEEYANVSVPASVRCSITYVSLLSWPERHPITANALITIKISKRSIDTIDHRKYITT